MLLSDAGTLFTGGNFLVGVITIVLVGVSALAAWATFRSTNSKTTQANLSALSESWERRFKEKESEIQDLQTKMTEKDHQLATARSEVEHLQATVKELREMVTGRAAVDNLAVSFNQGLTQIIEGLDKVLQEVAENRRVFSAVMKAGTNE